MTQREILVVQILTYEDEDTDLDQPEMVNYVKEKLSQMHSSIGKDGQPLEVGFSQTVVVRNEE